MKLGIGTYTFPWHIGHPVAMPAQPWTHDDLLDEAIRLGAEVIQWCENLPLNALSAGQLDALEARAKQHGIAFEVGLRGLDEADILAHAELAARFGSSFVRLVIDKGADEPSPEEAVRRLRPIVRQLEAANIRLAIENHDRFRCRTLLEIIEQLGPLVGVTLDTANSLGCLEGTETVLNHLATLTLSLHIKDVKPVRLPHLFGFSVTGVAAGEGMLNIPAILETVRLAGRRPNVILEQWPPHDPGSPPPLKLEMETAERGFGYLRSVMA